MLATIGYTTAVVLLFLATLGIGHPRFHLGWAGLTVTLATATLAHLIPGGG